MENNEEDVLLEAYESMRFELEQVETELIHLNGKKRMAQQRLNDAKQAIIDYADANGIIKTERFSISKSKSVKLNCDIDDIPQEFVRTKKEPDKVMIKSAISKGQQLNWASLEETTKLTIKTGVK